MSNSKGRKRNMERVSKYGNMPKRAKSKRNERKIIAFSTTKLSFERPRNKSSLIQK